MNQDHASQSLAGQSIFVLGRYVLHIANDAETAIKLVFDGCEAQRASWAAWGYPAAKCAEWQAADLVFSPMVLEALRAFRSRNVTVVK